MVAYVLVGDIIGCDHDFVIVLPLTRKDDETLHR